MFSNLDPAILWDQLVESMRRLDEAMRDWARRLVRASVQIVMARECVTAARSLMCFRPTEWPASGSYEPRNTTGIVVRYRRWAWRPSGFYRMRP